jgi:hypothetical protein
VDNKNKVQLYYKKLFGKKEEIKQINVVIPDLNVNMHIPVADEKINPNVLPSLVKIRITGR